MNNGSYRGGFVLGCLFGLFGLIISLAINLKQTTKGAIHGFLFRIGMIILGFVSISIYSKLMMLGLL